MQGTCVLILQEARVLHSLLGFSPLCVRDGSCKPRLTSIKKIAELIHT
jgi:hypothetical protein